MKTIKYIIYKEGKHFVSQSLNVDVSSFGNTVEEATSNLKEALNLYFEDEPSQKKYFQIKEALLGEMNIK
jgi:predicted RNase H-like HicB family nuclease